MIVVSAGTHAQPFDRLVRAASSLAMSGASVVLQRGTSSMEADGCTVKDWLGPSELDALCREADAVVVHGGLGSIFMAWEAGHRPVVIPRRPDLGEHVDDHQLAFAAHLGDRIVVPRLGEPLAVACVRAGPRTFVVPDYRSAFCRDLDALVSGLVNRRF